MVLVYLPPLHNIGRGRVALTSTILRAGLRSPGAGVSLDSFTARCLLAGTGLGGGGVIQFSRSLLIVAMHRVPTWWWFSLARQLVRVLTASLLRFRSDISPATSDYRCGAGGRPYCLYSKCHGSSRSPIGLGLLDLDMFLIWLSSKGTEFRSN